MSDVSVGSLFSGIGGIELGLEMAGGFETRWFVECNSFAAAVLRKHYSGIPIYPDITRIEWGAVEPVDMLTGGFPCQDISNAGKRKGIGGERSGLWKEYLRAIRSLRPKIILVENVSALTNRGLDVVLGDLSEAGYDAEWFDLRASDVGALHRRERLFIVAYSTKLGLYRQEDEQGLEGEGGSEFQFGEPRDSADVAHPNSRRGCGCERDGEGNMQRAKGEEPHDNIIPTSQGCDDVSYPDEQRCDNRSDNRQERYVLPNERIASQSEPEGQGRQRRIRQSGADVADAECLRLECAEEQGSMGEAGEGASREGCESTQASENFYSSRSNGQGRGGKMAADGSIKPGLGRVVDGFSRGLYESGWLPEPEGIPRVTKERKHRKERIMCLGNAVVPECAYVIGMAIKEGRA